MLIKVKMYRFVTMERRQIIISDKELWEDFISGGNEAFQTIYENTP